MAKGMGKTDQVELIAATRTLGLMLQSGVPIMDSMKLVASDCRSKKIGGAFLKAREAMREGEGISGPLKATGVFPAAYVQMVNVGEETGKLDQILLKLADYLELDASMGRDPSSKAALVIRQMAVGQSVGLPLVQGLMIVAEGLEEGKLKGAVSKMASDISAGGKFGEALAKHPDVFPAFVGPVVTVGENYGSLDATLDRLAGVLEKQAVLRQKAK